MLIFTVSLKDVPLGDVKLKQVGDWVGRRDKSPTAIARAFSRWWVNLYPYFGSLFTQLHGIKCTLNGQWCLFLKWFFNIYLTLIWWQRQCSTSTSHEPKSLFSKLRSLKRLAWNFHYEIYVNATEKCKLHWSAIQIGLKCIIIFSWIEFREKDWKRKQEIIHKEKKQIKIWTSFSCAKYFYRNCNSNFVEN